MPPPPPYRILLAILTGLFAFRVAAQFFAQQAPLPLLPPFELWHSATLPYPVLLTGQLVLLAGMAALLWCLPFARPRLRLGAFVIGFGWLYLAVMAGRLIVGVSGASAHPWFDAAVATAFHFVLAAFVLVLGAALRGPSRAGAGAGAGASPAVRMVRHTARYAAWPVLIAGSFALFVWLRDTGSPLLFAAWLAALIGVLGVLLHETFLPLRDDWRPTRGNVASDATFLVLVQIALPQVLKALALLPILGLAGANAGPLAGWWPQQTPLLLQVALMLLVAEFFRYWLHRALHVRPLWPLHAVHHAADKLYTLNVGRFHPLDKALQFLGDTLPFLLFGVAPDVFAAYFVLYAVNGFYQHSNADVRLGPLNWLVAGPELHRWHHSTVPAEAHANFGNNLIVWDALFGTRFLPRGRAVGRVGIANTAWPDGFAAQLVAPFTISTDAPPVQSSAGQSSTGLP